MIRILLLLAAILSLVSCANNTNVMHQGLGIMPNFDAQGMSQQQLLQKHTVLFDFDKTDIKPQFMPLIEAHAAYLSQHPDKTILLAGNTDAQGSREYNMGLGERRTQSVANVLMANGVNSKQIVSVSYGPEVPLACGNNEAAYAQNRRVDILYCQTSTCKQIARNYAHNTCSYTQ